MKEIPFGIEYVKNVDIIELNLGLSSSVNANKIIINQHEDVPYDSKDPLYEFGYGLSYGSEIVTMK